MVNNTLTTDVCVLKTVDLDRMLNMRSAVMMDLAFTLAQELVKQGLIDISETTDPHTGLVQVAAKISVARKIDA